MKGKGQAYVKVARGFLVMVSIVILLWTGSWGSSAHENQGTSKGRDASQAIMEDRTDNGQQMSNPVLQHRNPRYKLCTGDIFELTFPFTPDFNQTVTVHPDGFITLSVSGDLYVAGKTVPEIRELLKTAYARVLHDPVINVVLKDFERPYFIVSGEIGRPGKYELRGDITVTQALAIAGGLHESSKHSQILLFRRVSTDWAEVKVLNVKKMFQAENLTEDLHLQPGDMLFVPQNRISKIRKWIPYTSISAGISPPF